MLAASVLAQTLALGESFDSVDVCAAIDAASPEVRQVVAAVQRARIDQSSVGAGAKFGGNWRPVGPYRPEPFVLVFGGVEGYRYEPREAVE